jgi:hypothetical protein
MDSKGYMKVTSREKHEPGCDLVFRYRGGGRYCYVEAKGDSRGKSQMETKLVHGLGQIVTRYRGHRNYLSGLAVPATWKRRALRKVSRDARKALRLDVFLVDEESRVSTIPLKEYTPRKALHA